MALKIRFEGGNNARELWWLITKLNIADNSIASTFMVVKQDYMIITKAIDEMDAENYWIQIDFERFPIEAEFNP